MKLFIMLAFLLIFVPVVSEAETINGHEVEWGSSTDYTLSWSNPSISSGDYVIKVIDFDWNGNVEVSVTRGGETQKAILSQGENSIFDFTKNATYFQGIKISASTVSNILIWPTNIGTYPCCPSAEISVTLSEEIAQKKPSLKLTFSPSWDGRSGFASPMRIEVNNTGDGDFSSGNVTINLNGLQIANQQELSDSALIYNPAKGTVTRDWSTPLLANGSYYFNLSIKPPFPSEWNKSTFTVTVESCFKDFNGNIYPATASATFPLNPAVNLKKSTTASTILGDRTYGNENDDSHLPKGLGKVTSVDLYIENIQSYPLKSVILTDTIMKDFGLRNGTVSPTNDFRLVDSDTLQWVFDLNESERKEFRYEMTAQKPGSFTLPAAVAQWDEMGVLKTASSDSPATRVYGIFVTLIKTTDKTELNLNESFNVTLNLENTGDFPVGINVTDILPMNTTFVSGNTAFSGYLYPSESTSLTYALSPDYSGDLILPSPFVTFWKRDYKGFFDVVPARNITVFKPSVELPAAGINLTITPTPTQSPLPKSLLGIIGEKAPWLEGAIPIIMLLFGIILMLMLHVTKEP